MLPEVLSSTVSAFKVMPFAAEKSIFPVITKSLSSDRLFDLIVKSFMADISSIETVPL